MSRIVTDRIWPAWTSNVAAMIEAEVIVRFACMTCRKIFDVDLVALAAIRGRDFSLMNATARCKLSSCRGTGHFVTSIAPDHAFILLVHRPELHITQWLCGLRPDDIDAPDPAPPRPRTPLGASAAEWTKADLDGRKWMTGHAHR